MEVGLLSLWPGHVPAFAFPISMQPPVLMLVTVFTVMFTALDLNCQRKRSLRVAKCNF